MKNKILALFLALLCCSTTLFAGPRVDALAEYIAGVPKVRKINLNWFFMGIIKPFSPQVRGVRSVKVLYAEDFSKKDCDKLQEMIIDCDNDQYDLSINDNEDGKEVSRVWVTIKKEKIREIVVAYLEKDCVTLVRVKGKIDPDRMDEVIEQYK